MPCGIIVKIKRLLLNRTATYDPFLAGLGKYPSCDRLNLALGNLLVNPEMNYFAIEEICHAIRKANGYFYEYVFDMLVRNGFSVLVEGANVYADD